MTYIGVFWTNFYLSSIQHGIQSAHVVGKMGKDPNDKFAYDQWATNDFVMNVRNGGDHEALQDMKKFFKDSASNYTWSSFYESDGALNGALTCVGIVLPDYVFAPQYEPNYQDTGFEAEVFRLIKSTSLAR